MFNSMKLKAAAVMTNATSMIAVSRPVIPLLALIVCLMTSMTLYYREIHLGKYI
jgi:hypothetical protein